MRKTAFIAIMLLIAAYSSSALGADDLMTELNGANQAFAKALLDKDIDHLVASYTSDACVLAPSAPRIFIILGG